jgi:hypothetical protein
MPQHGKDETEMVGVQAGHETAHNLERLAKREASTSAKMWRSPEDTASEYRPMTSGSSQVIPRSSVRNHG